MTYVVAQISTGAVAVCALLDYDREADTISVEFKGDTYNCAVSSIRRVRDTITEIAMSSNEQEAGDRIRAHLNEFRQRRTTALAGSPKPPRSRYASLSASEPPAPSPAKDAPAEKRACVAAPKEHVVEREAKMFAKAKTAVSPREAQRLYNDKMELFFPPGTKVTTKLPNGKLETCVTSKAFGKIFKLA
jgi:hypothetical protein